MTTHFLSDALKRFAQISVLPPFDRVFQPFQNQLLLIPRFEELLCNALDCFERTARPGHLTASAFVLSCDLAHVALTHHAKLKRWMQLGGHADGHFLMHEVALKEAVEEGGISCLQFLNWCALDGDIPIPFDLDIHEIPATPKEDAHLHYDVRYLLVAEEKLPLVVSEESIDVRWIALEEVGSYTQELSVLRMVDKVRLIRD
ncbi:MAG: NUDIX hydrolase [Anaerolineae bacterium]